MEKQNFIELLLLSILIALLYQTPHYLKDLSKQYGLKDISMGMSADYEQAIVNGSTFLRLGTSIFGQRKI